MRTQAPAPSPSSSWERSDKHSGTNVCVTAMAKQETQKTAKKPTSSKSFRYLGGSLLREMAVGGARALGTNSEEVNKLNVFPVPDGDTGDNMRMTIESGVAALEGMDSDDLAFVMQTLSHGMLLGARGNSGVILSQFFAGTARGLEEVTEADPEALGRAFEMGVKQAYSSVMTPTEGTILTVAREAVEYAVKKIAPRSTIRSFFADLVKEMRASLDRTPEKLAVLKEAGVVDSGGAGLFYIMDGFNRVLNGEEIAAPDDAVIFGASAAPKASAGFSFDENSEMVYGYCTELLLQLQNSKTDIAAFDVDELRAFLAKHGDSIVAFKTGSIVKLHVHTFTPEKILAHCRAFGEFLSVKIENMSVQHTDLAAEEKAPETPKEPQKADLPRKRYAVVAVALGVGIENLFLELGTDQIIRGGQTQNPSTNDFLEAFSRVNAEHIIVFPNNGNIVMAAGQAGELYTNATVHVLPSKNVGTGYVGLSALDFENEDVDAMLAAATEAMANATAGYISPAIRDADMNGVQIHDGDTIGIVEKDILFSVTDKNEAACRLASALLDMPEKYMLTVFCGADATEEQKETLTAYLAENYPSVEAYLIDGGQEIYPFVYVAE